MTPAFVTGAALPRTGLSAAYAAVSSEPARVAHYVVYAPLEIYAAKHVRLKAAKKANRRRPKKHRPSDINRAEPSCDPEPLRAAGLPETYSVLSPTEVAELETLKSTDDFIIITADEMKKYEAEIAEKKQAEEEAAAAELEERRVKRKAQRIKAKAARSEAHAAWKAERDSRPIAYAAEWGLEVAAPSDEAATDAAVAVAEGSAVAAAQSAGGDAEAATGDVAEESTDGADDAPSGPVVSEKP